MHGLLAVILELCLQRTIRQHLRRVHLTGLELTNAATKDHCCLLFEAHGTVAVACGNTNHAFF